MMKPVVNIYTESNPNPQSLKFVANFMIMPEGVSMDFPDIESTSNAPLAMELFRYPYVKRVFYMSNFVTITKDDSVEWHEIKDTLRIHIKSYFEEGKPILIKPIDTIGVTNENATELELKIKEVLDEYVKPAVEQDGGAITFHSFDSGTVKVALQGSCSGCPSSTVTLKAGIENLLKKMVPEVKEVVALAL